MFRAFQPYNFNCFALHIKTIIVPEPYVNDIWVRGLSAFLRAVILSYSGILFSKYMDS